MSTAGGGENCMGGATLSGSRPLPATVAGGLMPPLAGGILAGENAGAQAAIDAATAIKSAARETYLSA